MWAALLQYFRILIARPGSNQAQWATTGSGNLITFYTLFFFFPPPPLIVLRYIIAKSCRASVQELQTTGGLNKARSSSPSVVTWSFSCLILVCKFHLFQSYSSARIFWTAIEFHCNFCRRCSMYILVCHITNFNPRNLYKLPSHH